MKTIQIAYHAHCPDGIAAAAVFKHLVENRVNDIQLSFIPISYSNESEVLKQMSDAVVVNDDDIVDLIFLDYCPARGDYVNFVAQHKVLIIDHHAERVNAIIKAPAENTVIIYNNGDSSNASGAVLTLNTLSQLMHPLGTILLDMGNLNTIKTMDELHLNTNVGQLISPKLTTLVNHIGDYDTWTLAYANSPAVFNGLGIFASDVDWDLDKVAELLLSDNAIDVLQWLNKGTAAQIKDAIRRGYNYPSDNNPIIKFVNAPTSLASEIGRHVLTETNVSAVFVYTHNLANKRIDISIRSADDTSITALELAKVFGGGGHVCASGCRLAMSNMSIPEAILGDMHHSLLESILSQIKNPRDTMC